MMLSWTSKAILMAVFFMAGKSYGARKRAEHGVEVKTKQVEIGAEPPKDRSEIIDLMKKGKL